MTEIRAFDGRDGRYIHLDDVLRIIKGASEQCSEMKLAPLFTPVFEALALAFESFGPGRTVDEEVFP